MTAADARACALSIATLGTLLATLASTECNSSGSAKCLAAGGECRLGGCPSSGALSIDCNDGVVTPNGYTCCLPCPANTVEDAGQCVAGDAGGEPEVGAEAPGD